METIHLQNLENALSSNLFVILDFFSPGCAPCKAAVPVIEELVREARQDGVNIAAYSIDITQEPALAQKYFVLGVPTLILFKEGKEIQRLNAVPKKEKLKQYLK